MGLVHKSLTDCHTKGLEAQADDVECVICQECGTIITTVSSLRDKIYYYENELERIPSFIKRFFL